MKETKISLVEPTEKMVGDLGIEGEEIGELFMCFCFLKRGFSSKKNFKSNVLQSKHKIISMEERTQH